MSNLMTQDFDKYCEKLASYAKYVRSVIVSDYLDTVKNKTPENYYFTTIYRLNNSLYSVIFHAKNLNSFPQFAPSMELVLRTCLLDCILFYIVYENQLIHGIEYSEDINRLYSEHLNRARIELLNLMNIGFYSPDNVKEEFKSWNETYSNLMKKPIGNDGSLSLKYANGINVKSKINNELKEHTLAVEAYKLYCFYSKNEHLGAFSLNISNRIFSNELKLEVYKDLQRSIHIICHVTDIIINVLSSKNEEIKKQVRLRFENLKKLEN